MMNIPYMASMKCMKLMENILTYIECKFYVISYFLLTNVVIIISYLRSENRCNDSTIIAT